MKKYLVLLITSLSLQAQEHKHYVTNITEIVCLPTYYYGVKQTVVVSLGRCCEEHVKSFDSSVGNLRDFDFIIKSRTQVDFVIIIPTNSVGAATNSISK